MASRIVSDSDRHRKRRHNEVFNLASMLDAHKKMHLSADQRDGAYTEGSRTPGGAAATATGPPARLMAPPRTGWGAWMGGLPPASNSFGKRMAPVAYTKTTEEIDAIRRGRPLVNPLEVSRRKKEAMEQLDMVNSGGRSELVAAQEVYSMNEIGDFDVFGSLVDSYFGAPTSLLLLLDGVTGSKNFDPVPNTEPEEEEGEILAEEETVPSLFAAVLEIVDGIFIYDPNSLFAGVHGRIDDLL
jgi:hypothetical protein